MGNRFFIDSNSSDAVFKDYSGLPNDSVDNFYWEIYKKTS